MKDWILDKQASEFAVRYDEAVEPISHPSEFNEIDLAICADDSWLYLPDQNLSEPVIIECKNISLITAPEYFKHSKASLHRISAKALQRTRVRTVLIKNPLYDVYNKSWKVFAFIILNLIILGWLKAFPMLVIMPGITGLTMLSLIFFYETQVREYVEKKII